VVAGIGEDPQKLCENGDEMKVLNCIHLGDCEALNRIDGKEFDCDGCNQYSKFKSLTGNPGKEESMELEKRKCLICGNQYQPKRKDSRFCNKLCMDKWYRKNRSGNGKRKLSTRKNSTSIPSKIDDTIALDQQILKAIKKSVANQIVKIIQEAFA